MKNFLLGTRIATKKPDRSMFGIVRTKTENVNRYEKEFDSVHDVFELQVGLHPRGEITVIDFWQRNLNNAFAYDLVPSPGVVTAALKAARRVNDYPTAVRIFEGSVILGKGRTAANNSPRNQSKG